MTFQDWCELTIGDQIEGKLGTCTVQEASEAEGGTRTLTLFYISGMLKGTTSKASEPRGWSKVEIDKLPTREVVVVSQSGVTAVEMDLLAPTTLADLHSSDPEEESALSNPDVQTSALEASDLDAEAKIAIASALAGSVSGSRKPDRFEIALVEMFRPSPTNPRKHFDETKLAELSESINAHGVLQPIVCREVDDECYEIVAGERRYRASCIAGLTEIPCIVRDLTDVEVLEIQVIENNQRDDVHPMEECDGFAAILKSGLYGVGKEGVVRLAEKIGRSAKYVYDRLKFRDLCGQATTLFREGQITAGHAILLARLQPHDQLKAINYFNKFGGNGISIRDLDGWIEREIRRPLAKAPFKLDDATLLPIAGSCTNCIKRTGCESALFGVVDDDDRCLDSACWKAKTEDHTEAFARRAKEEHGPETIILALDYGAPEGMERSFNYKQVSENTPGAVPAVIGFANNASKVGELVYVKPAGSIGGGNIKTAEERAAEKEKNQAAREMQREREKLFNEAIKHLTTSIHETDLTVIANSLLAGLSHHSMSKLAMIYGFDQEKSESNQWSSFKNAFSNHWKEIAGTKEDLIALVFRCALIRHAYPEYKKDSIDPDLITMATLRAPTEQLRPTQYAADAFPGAS